MNEESGDNESDLPCGNIAQHDNNGPPDHEIAAAPTENNISSTVPLHEESHNDVAGPAKYETNADEIGVNQHRNLLNSGTSKSQSGKNCSFTGPAVQPGAIAITGPHEGNEAKSSGQGFAMSNDGGPQNEITKQTATMALGLEQEVIVLQARNPSSNTKSDAKADDQLDYCADKTDNLLDTCTALVNHAEFPEEDNACSDMIEAELVMPPIEAVRVSIDEDPTIAANHIHPFELEHAPTRYHSDGTRSKQFGPVFWALLALVVVTVLCATLIPYTLRLNDPSDEGSMPPTPSSPSGCYTTLLDILVAQVSDEEIDAPTYVICPNTKIKVGTFNNPATDDYRYVNGDYPIMVTRENVTIQCGWDGRRDNNCVIDAGFMQVLTLQVIAMADGSQYKLKRTNDHLLIRGITFTGIPINVGPFRGNSISLSHPGRNMRFEDCIWSNMTAQSGLIAVYRNYFQELVDLPLEDGSIDVTFADCIFENIVFDSPLIFVHHQAIKLERCIFREIRLSYLVEDYCRYTSGPSEEVVEAYQGCATLMHCASQSSCFMKDLCIDGMETRGQGIVVVYDDVKFQHESLFLEPNSTNASCDMAVISSLDGTNFSCSEIFDEPSCTLLP